MALTNDQDINIIIKARDQASATLSKLQNNIEKNSDSIKKLAVVSTGVFAAVTGTVLKSVAVFSRFEQAEVAFESMLGSAEKAKKMIAELAEFSAKTPFQFEDIIQATRTLLAFGVSSSEVNNKLQYLGDIAAGAQVPLAELAQIFGKVQTKGKAMTEEILQMSERGIPVIDALAKEFGVSKEAIFKMAEQGKLTADVVEKALKGMTTEGGIFANQMVKQSETIMGRWSTLKDVTTLTFSALGSVFSDLAANIIKKATGIIEKVGNWIETHRKLTAFIVTSIGVFAGLISVLSLLAMTVGPVIVVLKLLGLAASTALGPIGLVIGAISLLAGAFVAAKVSSGDSSTALDANAAAAEAAAAEAQRLASGLNTAGGAMADMGKSADDARKEIERLNKEMSDLSKSEAEKRLGYGMNVAEAIVDQEQTVRDIKKQIKEAERAEGDERSQREIDDLYDKLAVEQEALARHSDLKKQYATEVTEMRRRSNLTEFENKLETLMRERVADLQATVEKMSLLKIELENNKAILGQIEHARQTSANRQISIEKAKQDAIDKINAGKKFNFVSGYDYGSATTNKILGREHGGIIPGAIGQAVPIIAHGGERVIPASRANSGGAGSYTININNPVVSDRNDLNAIKAQIELAMRDVVRNSKLSLA